jgi:ring-1,2-phenylacetyl-CoA epoxidase subunit PaaC
MAAVNDGAVTAPLCYLLHLADTALVLGQRNAQWCGHGPVLEEDIAMANIGLDLIGQARMLYQHAASQSDTTEDRLAYFRDASQYRNFVIAELPQHTALAPGAAAPQDYAVTIVRNFLLSSYNLLLWEALQSSPDAQLAAIAAKSVKEVRYHLRHSADWLVRMGDGTPQSHAKAQAALDYLMPYTQEFWTPFGGEYLAGGGLGLGGAGTGTGAGKGSDDGAGGEVGVGGGDERQDQGKTEFATKNRANNRLSTWTFACFDEKTRLQWLQTVAAVISQATLKQAPSTGHIPDGKHGHHSEHLSYLLLEMQSLARAHPEAQW